MDGSRTRSVARPSATIAAWVTWRRVSGGHTTLASAIPTGTSIVIPTMTSRGPPGRYAERISAAASPHAPTSPSPMSRSPKRRTRTSRSLLARVSASGCESGVGAPGQHRKYRSSDDGWVMTYPTAPDQSARTAPDCPEWYRNEHEGPVGHGRAGSARFTGTRGNASPRFVGAVGRGGVQGRTWLRGHDPEALRALDDGSGRDDPTGDQVDVPQSRDPGLRS